MITVCVLGLDQFVVGHYSKEHTINIANLYETDESSVSFYAPNSMLFHNGVEQTSWNTIVLVRAPKKFAFAESKVAKYLIETMKDFTINLEVDFEYFDEGNHYEFLNSEYPRFITESNMVTIEDDAPEGEEDPDGPDPRDRADLDYNNPDELFLGDAFKELGKKLPGEEDGPKSERGPKK
jgi:hypothetical protein